MREDVVPYVVSCIFLISTAGVIIGYGLFRKFNVKKTEYGFYGEEGPPDGSGGGIVDDEAGERIEMRTECEFQRNSIPTNGVPARQHQDWEEPEEMPVAENGNGIQKQANPFRNKPATNPFQQQ